MASHIETARLILRPWEDADVAHWIAMGADERVMEFFPGLVDRTEAEAQVAHFRDRLAQNGFGWWALETKADGLFAGTIALQDVPIDLPFAPALEVGWRLSTDYWGRGYATEGARAALDFAFRELGRTEVVAMTARRNLRSQAVMQRLGMTRSVFDDFEHPRIAPGHPIRDHVLYRIARGQT